MFEADGPKAVAVSGRFLRAAQPTGTQKSARRLLAATLRAGFADIVLYGPDLDAEFAKVREVRPVRFRNALFDHFWEQSLLPLVPHTSTLWTLMGTGPIFHPGKRHVMVVHDLNYHILPHVFGKAFRMWYQFACGAAARRADVVVCFTNYVRGTIHERLRILPERIRVIPQGPGLKGMEQPDEDQSVEAIPERPYFLCVGSLQPHKNLNGVLAAWDAFHQRHASYSLKVVGRAQSHFAALGVEVTKLPQGVEFTGYISDGELAALYRRATGFLYPSIEEGFGLPVVEAFYCGCPVITSNQSCLPEVVDDAAILVNPHAPQDLAEAMSRLVESPRLRQHYRTRGLKRARYFSWANAGKQMAGVLDEVTSRTA
jgi:glycosyltransferase involved in cell wall biosynthesis